MKRLVAVMVFCTQWFKTGVFSQIHVLFHQNDVLHLRAWTNTGSISIIQNILVLYRRQASCGWAETSRGELRVSCQRQLSRTGRDRNTSLGLVKVSVTVARAVSF